jgi:hypothetical protein
MLCSEIVFNKLCPDPELVNGVIEFLHFFECLAGSILREYLEIYLAQVLVL